MKKIGTWFLFYFLAYLWLWPISACFAQSGGAVLFLSPATGDYNVGRTFTVNVAVSSGGGSGINAAEGSIKFDPAALSVSRLSDAGSIFKLWTTDPTFSNSAGTIRFGGGSPGPYTGTNGTIFSITFTAKKAGLTEVNYSSGIVLAADGKGTNVFSGFGNAKYNITEAAPVEERPAQRPTVEPKEETVRGLIPPLPDVSSETHPEDDIWYANNQPEFSWKVLADLIAVSFSVSSEPLADPGAATDGIVESVIFDEGVPDGEQYFHIKYRNKSGWGQTAHRKFLVDVTPPEPFNIVLDSGSDPTNPAPKLKFKTIDKASGLDYYQVEINGMAEKISVAEMEKGYYQPQPLAPGEHRVNVAAVDKAGNTASSSAAFMIDALKAPIITDIPKTINQKEELIIRGTSFYPSVTVKVFIGGAGKPPLEASVKTDSEGNWSYFHKEKIEKGMYEVWAKLIDDRGAQSLESTKHLISIESISIVDRFGLLLIIILLLSNILLFAYIFYQRKEFEEEKRRIMRETEEVKTKLSKIFQALREEVEELVQMADKRPGFSEAERRVKEKLEESLDISEEFISKEVTDIEKEIKLPDKKEK